MKKLSPMKEVVNGQIVLCKLRGYCEWPARILNIDGKKINVQFFGDNTTANTNINNIYDFRTSFEVILNNLRNFKRDLYAYSVMEAEKAVGISKSMSILNRINDY